MRRHETRLILSDSDTGSWQRARRTADGGRPGRHPDDAENVSDITRPRENKRSCPLILPRLFLFSRFAQASSLLIKQRRQRCGSRFPLPQAFRPPTTLCPISLRAFAASRHAREIFPDSPQGAFVKRAAIVENTPGQPDFALISKCS